MEKEIESERCGTGKHFLVKKNLKILFLLAPIALSWVRACPLQDVFDFE